MNETPPALPWWQHLEALRLDRDWTRIQLAERAGVARTTIDKWKTARRAPLNTTVTEVADRLGIDKEQALQLAGVIPPPAAAAREPNAEDPHDRLERLARELRELQNDPVSRRDLRALLDERSAPDLDELFERLEGESEWDWVERLVRYLKEPGPRREVLRGLVESWGDRDVS